MPISYDARIEDRIVHRDQWSTIAVAAGVSELQRHQQVVEEEQSHPPPRQTVKCDGCAVSGVSSLVGVKIVLR